LYRVRQMWKSAVTRVGDDDDDKGAKVERKKEVEAWWRELLVNLCYFPMTVHWGKEEGILSESSVGLLGAVAGGTALKELWKKNHLNRKRGTTEK